METIQPASSKASPVVVIDPLQHRAWDSLLAAHPESSFFHSSAWARVLNETYGHRPVYFTRLEQDQLQGLLPLMEVTSPCTGRRGVSLPFTDFCPLLGTNRNHRRELCEHAMGHGRNRRWRYVELRSTNAHWPGALPSLVFWGHVIDLECGLDELFQRLHSSTRQGIRKAKSSRLQITIGNTFDSMQNFYRLHCRTRRKHGLPPQPFRFFQSIAEHVLGPGRGFIVTASFEESPVAAAVFLHRRRQAIYKFGASDPAAQHLRPNNLVMWEAIQWCTANGFASLHLGRTSLGNPGLRHFKLGFGAREERIEYLKYDFAKEKFVTDVDRVQGWFNHLFRCLPAPLLRLAGHMLYPHLS